MTDYSHNRGPATPGTSERVVHTTKVRESGAPGTGFIIGGLVVAVAVIAFIIFGGDAGQTPAEVNMPPAVENNIAAPSAPAAPSNDAGATTNSGSVGGATSATPPAADTNTAN